MFRIVWKPVGYVLNWGGRILVAGRYANVNAVSSDGTTGLVLNESSEHVAPKAGVMVALSWNTQLADATTVVKVHKNGLVVETLTLTAAFGSLRTLTTPVAAGDRVAIEVDAGTLPGNGTYNLEIVQ